MTEPAPDAHDASADAAARWFQEDHAVLARQLGSERAAREREAVERLGELVGVVFRLRDPDGCPWDRSQDLDSMAANLVEEAHEAAEAVAEHDDAHVAEELGDTLMNVVLMSRIAEQEGRFDLAQVAAGIATKLVRRHAHVFGDVEAEDAETALASWKATKRREREGQGSALDGVPAGLPALLAALRLGYKAAAVGFDWPSPEGALDKLREELDELVEASRAASAAAAGDEAHAAATRDALEDELGDVLFSAVNVARKHDLDPELALRRTLAKFRRRFGHIEASLGDGLESASLEAMEALWRDAVRIERQG